MTTPGSSSSNAAAVAVAQLSELKERRNWMIHQLFVRQEYTHCLSVIEAQLRETDGMCEYALYVKGLLKRMQGFLTESLALLEAAVLVSPENAANRKQFGRAMQLIGRHQDAIEAFREAAHIRGVKGLGPDWELPFCTGVCHAYLRQYDLAVQAFMESMDVQRNDVTFIHLGRALICKKDWRTAIGVYEEALAYSPENPELLVLLGQLHLQMGHTGKAFGYLGQCLTLDQSNATALLAASSIIQDKGDYDVALTKYRIAVTRMPDSAQLWNNIGMCFFAKDNAYAAVACLRKAIFLNPLEWIPNYNLGIVFISMGRHASAFNCLSAVISLNAHYASAYMFLGVCLSLMNDPTNACAAYEKALCLDDDLLVRLNYAVTLYNSGMPQPAAQQLAQFLPAWEALAPEQRQQQPTAIPATVRQLQQCLSTAASSPPARSLQPAAGIVVGTVVAEEAPSSSAAASAPPPSDADDETPTPVSTRNGRGEAKVSGVGNGSGGVAQVDAGEAGPPLRERSDSVSAPVHSPERLNGAAACGTSEGFVQQATESMASVASATEL